MTVMFLIEPVQIGAVYASSTCRSKYLRSNDRIFKVGDYIYGPCGVQQYAGGDTQGFALK